VRALSLTAALSLVLCLGDSKLIAFVGLPYQAGVWDLVTGRRLQGFKDIASKAIAVSPAADLLAVCYVNTESPRNGHTEVWRMPASVPKADDRAK